MPQFKQCLGVDLGVNSVKIVELAMEKDRVRVVRAASAPTGVQGNMPPEEVRAAIVLTTKELIKKGRFGTRKAVFSLSGSKMFVKRFRLPVASEERMARMIQYEARNQVPIPLEKAYLQYQVRELPGESEVEILLAAVRTDELRDQMGLLLRCGLTPIGLGVSTLALYNGNRFLSLGGAERVAFFESRNPKKAKKSAKAAAKGPAPAADNDATITLENEGEQSFAYEEVRGYLNIGAASADLAIGRVVHGPQGGGTVAFTRTMTQRCGDEMTRAVMKACAVESFLDAERIKTSAAQIMSFNFDFEEGGSVNQEASNAVTEVAESLVIDIRRTLDFFITQPDGMAIDSLVVSGGQGLLPGFDAFLEEKLSVPVTIAQNAPEDPTIVWPESAGPIAPYVIALGLGLQGLELVSVKVDFLPEERKIIRDFPYRVTAIMLGFVLLTTGIASQAGKDYANKFRAAVAANTNVIESNQKASQEFLDAQAQHDEAAKEFTAVAKLFGQRDFWVNFLAQLAEIKPPDILLTDVQFEHDGRVTIEGFSQQQVAAAYFRDSINQALKGRMKAVQRPVAVKQATVGGPPVATPTAPREEAIIDEIVEVPRPPAPFNPGASRFKIILHLNDKVNHLKITPTPTPTPVGGGPAAVPGNSAQRSYF
jgi:Tfp pilus assembly PilM family ATPase